MPTAPLTRAEKLRNLIGSCRRPTSRPAASSSGRHGIDQAYVTGRGSIMMRAKTEIETNKKGDRQAIIVTEIPYQVNKAQADREDRRPGAREEASRASPTSATSPTATACAW